MKRFFFVVLFCFPVLLINGQTTSGNTGLLNIPSAEMQKDGTLMFGANYLPQTLTPEKWDYNTGNYFINITFLPFLEVSYRMTLLKNEDSGRFTEQDRAFSGRLRILKEQKLRPAFVIGGNDLYTTGGFGNQYFGALYGVATKNLETEKQKLQLTLGFSYNVLKKKEYQGLFGGISVTPFPNFPFNMMAEYDTEAINAGASVVLFKHHLYLYGLAYDLRYFSGGARLSFNLF